MGIRQRIERIEKRFDALGPPQDAPHAPALAPALAPAIRALDGLIRRLDEQTRELEEDPEGYVEGCDDVRYGETLKEHEARVGALMDALVERDEAWRREHRPDLVGVPNEIDDHIARLNREIEEIRTEMTPEELAEGGAG